MEETQQSIVIYVDTKWGVRKMYEVECSLFEYLFFGFDVVDLYPSRFLTR